MERREILEKMLAWIYAEIEKAKKPPTERFLLTSLAFCAEKAVSAELPTRLDNRSLDLRKPRNLAVFSAIKIGFLRLDRNLSGITMTKALVTEQSSVMSNSLKAKNLSFALFR